MWGGEYPSPPREWSGAAARPPRQTKNIFIDLQSELIKGQFRTVQASWGTRRAEVERRRRED